MSIAELKREARKVLRDYCVDTDRGKNYLLWSALDKLLADGDAEVMAAAVSMFKRYTTLASRVL